MERSVPTREQRQAQTRRRLLAAAARVFAARGFHGASVSAIAATAGLTTGALYANFAGKEDLFLEMIDAQLAGQADALAELDAISDPAQMRAQLRQRVEQLLAGMASPGDLLAPEDDGSLTTIQVQTLTLEFLLYVVRERPDLHDEITTRYRTVEVQLAGIFERWLNAEGRTSDIPPEELAKIQSWLIEGMGLRLLQDPDHIEPSRAADLYLRLLTDLPLRPSADMSDILDMSDDSDIS